MTHQRVARPMSRACLPFEGLYASPGAGAARTLVTCAEHPGALPSGIPRPSKSPKCTDDGVVGPRSKVHKGEFRLLHVHVQFR